MKGGGERKEEMLQCGFIDKGLLGESGGELG